MIHYMSGEDTKHDPACDKCGGDPAECRCYESTQRDEGMSDTQKLWPLSTDEAPADREWTDLEWVRNQWCLAIEQGKQFDREIAKLKQERDDTLTEVTAMLPICDLWYKLESRYPEIAESVRALKSDSTTEEK